MDGLFIRENGKFTFFLMDDLGAILFSLQETGLYIDLALNQSRQTLNLGLDPAWYHLWLAAWKPENVLGRNLRPWETNSQST